MIARGVHIVAVACSVSLLAGCASTGTSIGEMPIEVTPDPRSVTALTTAMIVAESLDADVADAEPLVAEWYSGERSGRVEAYFAEDRLVLIRETLESPDSGRSENAYYFQHGQLYYFHGASERDARGGAPEMELAVVFGRFEEVEGSDKRIRGRTTPIEPTDVAQILSRAAELRSRIQAATTTS